MCGKKTCCVNLSTCFWKMAFFLWLQFSLLGYNFLFGDNLRFEDPKDYWRIAVDWWCSRKTKIQFMSFFYWILQRSCEFSDLLMFWVKVWKNIVFISSFSWRSSEEFGLFLTLTNKNADLSECFSTTDLRSVSKVSVDSWFIFHLIVSTPTTLICRIYLTIYSNWSLSIKVPGYFHPFFPITIELSIINVSKSLVLHL